MMWWPISPSRGGQKGYTLVEVMVAFAISALLAGGVFAVLANTSRRARELDAMAVLRQRGEAVLALVTEDLAAAFVPPAAGTFPFFIGEDDFSRDRAADRVDFLSTAALPFDPQAPLGDLAEVGYRLSFPENGPGVLYRREEVPPREPDGEGGSSAELCREVTGFNLKYSDGSSWFDQWDSTDPGSAWSKGQVPREVEVTLTLEDAAGRRIGLRTRVALSMAGKRS